MNTLLTVPKRKTKIVATLGPASGSPEKVRKLIEAGVNLFRLNFSHGTHEDHSKLLKTVREESKALNRYVAVLQDLCGPKVRVGEIEGGEILLPDGGEILLVHDGRKGSLAALNVEAFDPAKIMKPGERALLADGRIELRAEKVSAAGVSCRILAGGTLRSRSGIAVPESRLNLPCLTEKDLKDLRWGVENSVDFVALSFVGTGDDVRELRAEMQKLGKVLPIVSKIERSAALDNINEIVELSDGVMVARGDLGLELPLERVPTAQRLIIETANHRGTPVITATQMLQSMVKEIRPTRAEVTDVSTAVRDGTDAVMLSEETAVGAHPVEAVCALDAILTEAEKQFTFEQYKPRLKGSDRETVPDAICYAACGAANKISASAIIACTQSGHTARLIAKYRPQQALFGATSEIGPLTKMALYWGVIPIQIPVKENYTTEEEVTAAMTAIRDQFGVKPGSRVVLTAGLRAKKSGTTSLLEIRDIPRNA